VGQLELMTGLVMQEWKIEKEKGTFKHFN